MRGKYKNKKAFPKKVDVAQQNFVAESVQPKKKLNFYVVALSVLMVFSLALGIVFMPRNPVETAQAVDESVALSNGTINFAGAPSASNRVFAKNSTAYGDVFYSRDGGGITPHATRGIQNNGNVAIAFKLDGTKDLTFKYHMTNTSGTLPESHIREVSETDWAKIIAGTAFSNFSTIKGGTLVHTFSAFSYNSSHLVSSIYTAPTVNLDAGYYVLFLSTSFTNSYVNSLVISGLTYTLTFDDNTEETVSNMPTAITSSGSITLPETVPTREGYTFSGWSTTSDGSVSYLAGASYTLSATATLYAVWEEASPTTYTLTFDDNTEETVSNMPTAITSSGSITLPETVPTREGYTFSGWSTTSDGSVSYLAGASYTLSATATLYAVWEEASPTTYTLTFDDNTEETVSNMPTAITSSGSITLPETVPTREGYTFSGWSTTSDGSVSYLAGASYTLSATATLYAVWTVNTQTQSYVAEWSPYTYTIIDGVKTYSDGNNAFGSSWNPSSSSLPLVVYNANGVTLTALNNCSVDTHKETSPLVKFGSTNQALSLVVPTNAKNVVITADVVVFSGKTGTAFIADEDQTALATATNFTSDIPGVSDAFVSFTSTTITANSISGGTFYIGRSGSNNVYLVGIKVTYDLTTSAETTFFTVTYNANEGICDPAYNTVAETLSVTLPLPTRSGYVFAGWFDALVSGTKIGDNGATYIPTANITLYARWVKEITISLYGVNGATVDETVIETDTIVLDTFLENELINLPRPIKSGVAFVGWFIDSSFETAVILDGNGKYLVPSNNITLYAMWSEITSQVIDIHNLTTYPNDASSVMYANTTTMSKTIFDDYLVSFSFPEASTNTWRRQVRDTATNKYGLQTINKTTTGNQGKLYFNLNSSATVKIFLTAEGKSIVFSNDTYSTSNGQLNYTYNGSSEINMRPATSAEATMLGSTVDGLSVVQNTIAVIERQVSPGGTIEIFTGNKATIYYISIDYVSQSTEQYDVTYSVGGEFACENMPSNQNDINNDTLYTIPNVIPTADNYIFYRWAVNGVTTTYYQPGDSFKIYSDVEIVGEWLNKIARVNAVTSILDTEQATQALSLTNASEKWAALGLPMTVNGVPSNVTLSNISVSILSWDVSTVGSTVGVYTAIGSLDVAPSGYAYDGVLTVTAVITVNAVSAETVNISGGFASNLVVGENWRSGLTVSDGEYIAYNSGDSFDSFVINMQTINGKSVVNANAPKYIGINPGNYNPSSTSENLLNAGMKITVPASASGRITLRVGALVGNTPTIYVLNSNGEAISSYSFSTSDSIEASLTTIVVSLSGNEESTDYYVMCTNSIVLFKSIVAQSAVELETDYSVSYQKGSYGADALVPLGTVSTATRFYGNSLIFVNGIGNIVTPSHYSFGGWQVGVLSTKYFEGDVYQMNNANVAFVATWVEFQKYTITYNVLGYGANVVSDPIYSGDYAVKFVPNNYTNAIDGTEWGFVGWYIDSNLTNQFNFDFSPITANITLYAKWELVQGNVELRVSTISQRTYTVGTLLTEITLSLPTRLSVQDSTTGASISGVYAVVSSWALDTLATGNYATTFSTSSPQLYRFVATLNASTPLVDSGDSEVLGYSLVNQTITCDVNVVLGSGVTTYEAEYRAYSYTTNPDGSITYNNDSDTYGRNWTQYYTLMEDGYLIIGRNGLVTIGADVTTSVGRSNQMYATICDDAHEQTKPIVKAGYGTTESLRISVPTSGVFNTKITLYATRFRTRTSSNPPIVTIRSADNTTSVTSDPITAITYTESDYGTDFNDFHPFTPDATVFEYAGGGIFFVDVASGRDNVYITGIKVEYQVAYDTEFATVYYHANNGTDKSDYSREYIATPVGIHNAVLDLNSFVNEGYVFVGWATSVDGNKVYDAGQSVRMVGTNHLYAVWSSTDSITYMRNAPNVINDVESFTIYYPHGVTVADNPFEVAGYSFSGWSTSNDGTVDYLPGDRIDDISGYLTYYAVWTAGNQIIAEFSAFSYTVADSEMIYNNNAGTFNTSWTSKYTTMLNGDNVLAKNGDLSIVTSNANTSSNPRYKSMIVLAQNDTIDINVPTGLYDVRIYVYVVSGSSSSSSRTTIQVRGRVNGTTSTLATANDVSLYYDAGTTFARFRPQILLAYYGHDNTAGSVSIVNTSARTAYISGVRVEAVTSNLCKKITYNGNNNVASDVRTFNLMGDSIFDINYFTNPGSQLSEGWYPTASGTSGTPSYYGSPIQFSTLTSDNTTFYSKWTPLPYKVRYTVFGEDGMTVVVGPTIMEDSVYVVGVTNRTIPEPLFVRPEEYSGSSYALDGWYTDAEMTVLWPLTNNLTYGMVDADGFINIYAKYFEVTEKDSAEIVAVSGIHKELAEVLEELSGVSYTTTASLGLPDELTVSLGTGANAIDYNLPVTWLLNQVSSTKGPGYFDITQNSALGLYTYTIYCTVRLPDELFKTYAFGVKDNDDVIHHTAQTTTLGVTVELMARIIDFPLNNPLPNSVNAYPTNTAYKTIMDNMNIVGRYTTNSQYVSLPINAEWECSPEYDSSVAGNYVLSTSIVAPRGYLFRSGITPLLSEGNDGISNATLSPSRDLLSFNYNFTLIGSSSATAVAGFVRDNMPSLTTAWSTGLETLTEPSGYSYYVVGTNGGVRVLVNTNWASFDSRGELYSMIKIGNTNSVSLRIPSGTNINDAYVIVEASVYSTSSVASLLLRANGFAVQYSIDGGEFVSGNQVSLAGTSAGYDSQMITKTIVFHVSGLNGNGATLSLGRTETDTDAIYLQKLIARVHNVATNNDTNTINYYTNTENRIDDVNSPYIDDALAFILTAQEAGLTIDEGYELAGWSTINGSNIVNYKSGQIIALSNTVNALFPVIRPLTKTVVFHANYGNDRTVNAFITQGSAFSTITGSGTINSTETINAVNALAVRDGFAFDGWYNASVDGSLMHDRYSVEVDDPSGEYHVWAYWTVKQYDVVFNTSTLAQTTLPVSPSQSILDLTNVSFDSTISAPPVQKGTHNSKTYSLLGWYVDSARTKQFDFSKTLAENNDIFDFVNDADLFVTLYAKWGVTVDNNHNIPNYHFPDIHTSEFDSNLTTNPSATVTLQMPIGGERGYYFDGWYTDELRSEENRIVGNTVSVYCDTIIYGNWKPRNCNVVFNYNDGTGNQSDTSVLYNQSVEPANIVGTFVVAGWYLDAECSRPWNFSDKISFAESGDLVEIAGVLTLQLYAKWGVNVVFEINPQVVDFGFVNHIVAFGEKPVLITNPSVIGYSFENYSGYYDYLNGTYRNWTLNDVVLKNAMVATNTNYHSETKSLTITANFVVNESQHSIVFNSNGFSEGKATCPDAQTVVHNGTFSITSEFVATSLYATFVGWSLTEDASSGILIPRDEDPQTISSVQNNITLFAQWTAIQINDVSVLGNSETNEFAVDISDGSSISDVVLSKVDGSNVVGNEIIFNGQNILPVTWDLTNAYQIENDVVSGVSVNLTTMTIQSNSVFRITGIVDNDNGKYTFVSPLVVTNNTVEITADITVYSNASDVVITDIRDLTATFNLNSGEALGRVQAVTVSGVVVMLDVNWNSQIDTSVSGTHFVKGVVTNLRGYTADANLDYNVTATVSVTSGANGGPVNPNVYKQYQSGALPTAPSAPIGYAFICWTEHGTGAYIVGNDVPAGEYTAKFAKLEMISVGIRVSKDYSGLRFTARLTFSDSTFVRELMTFDNNGNSAYINTTMAIAFDQSTIGGHNFKNIVIDGSTVTFSGVITGIVEYNPDGTVNVQQSTKRSTQFMPTAIVRLGNSTMAVLTATSEHSYSASDVASQIVESENFANYSSAEQSIIRNYIV